MTHRVARLLLSLWGALLVGWTPAPASPLPAAAPLDPVALEAQLRDLYQKAGVRAMIASISQGDRQLVSLALGDSLTGVPATVEDSVRMGGISETFLGVVLMRLVENGVVRLEDRLSRWLPELPGADQVTLEMLMTNTAGYPDYVYQPRFTEALLQDPFRQYTRDEIIRYATEDGKLNFPPGTRFAYSHTEFTILGEALVRATGRSMEDLHEELVFRPAGLRQTHYRTDPQMTYPVLHAYSSDRGVYEDSTFWNPSWTGDSGPLTSTVDEIARWVRMHGRGVLLQPASQARLVARPAAAPSAGRYFAYGFMVSHGWYAQNPSFNGYSGGYAYHPEKDLSVVVYTTDRLGPTQPGPAFATVRQLVALMAPDAPLGP